MMENTLTYIETLIHETQKTEAEILTMVFRVGLRQLWREHVLGRYLRGEIQREEAIEKAGIDWVELAEHQYESMMEDMKWALGK